MLTETILLNPKRNVSLTAYLLPVGGEFPDIPNRPAVLILPGGGYRMCSDREADPVAFSYLKAGYHAFILRYSVGGDAAWPNPLDDYEQAMELIHQKAGQWHVLSDKIAVIGFSAGGHLAACAASAAQHRPAAAILGYPVITYETIGMRLPSAPDAAELVHDDTCPCFLFASRTDDVVSIRNSLALLCALQEHAIAFESHIYAYGPHGVSTADSSVQPFDTRMAGRSANWVADSIQWLKEMLGDFGRGELTAPRCEGRTNADREPQLSIDCSMAHLFSHPQALPVLSDCLALARQRFPELFSSLDEKGEAFPPALGDRTLRQILSYINAPRELSEQLQQALRAIENRP